MEFDSSNPEPLIATMAELFTFEGSINEAKNSCSLLCKNGMG
jgi:hypothetical protein